MNNIVAFIPIRLNSKRVKNKNVRILKGRPLFCWCLESLDKLKIPVYVYTNYSEVLINCLDFIPSNIEFIKRPKYLDDDKTVGIEIYKQFANDIPSEKYLLCHCTSPFVSTDTYKKCIDLGDYDSSMTVQRIQTFCWYDDKPLNFKPPRPRTQDIKPIFVETSAAYCYTKEVLDRGERTSDCPLKIETHYPETIDIDTEEDFIVAENSNV